MLGPLLYTLRSNLHLHSHAADCQVYTSVAVGDVTSAVQSLAACVTDIDIWTSASRLRFNPSKMEIVWLCAGHILQQEDINVIPVLYSAVKVVQSARDLGA